ncbi:hypothetical protein M1555_04130 [Patescibacteria group bacterium]|nr:hypothetical protein [Patescibacteria group bacterium]
MHTLAQSLNLPGGQTITGPVPYTDIGSVLSKALPYVFAFAGFGLLLMIVAAGITLMTSAGDAKKMEQGKQRLTYALVGFFVIFFSYWIMLLIGRIFGIQEINTIFQ